MSRKQDPPPSASSGGGDESDLRSQLFAPLRNSAHSSARGGTGSPAAGAPLPSVAAKDRAVVPMTAAPANKPSSPAVTPSAKSQTPPVPPADAPAATPSPSLADGTGGSAGTSLESVVEELNRRKTHNVSQFAIVRVRL
jgi:hypothetical protein